jgi:multidrug efflux pump
MAPAGTPPAIVNKLHAEFVRILRLPDMQEKLAALGLAQADVNSTLSTAWGGRYVNDLVRVGEEWRIEVLRLEVRWVQGDRAILDR